jgi:hypothetical protein
VSDPIAEVRAAYELEMKTRAPPVAAGDLPVDYADISDEWLTKVICRMHPTAKVISHRLDAPDEGNTSRRRIFLKYNETGVAAGLPASVFCKSSFRLATRISVGICGGLESEVNFYNHIRPLMDVEAPVAVWANFNPNSYNSIVMLKDLAGKTEFCTLETKMTEERLRSQLSLLARFHGQFFNRAGSDGPLAGLITWPQFFTNVVQLGFETLCGNGFNAGKPVIPARLFARAKEIWPATLAAVEQQRHLPHTLLHADVHLRNWYVSETGSMGLSDWQNACRGHWGRDVAYTLCTSMSVEQRRTLAQPLLRFYLETLHEAGGPAVAFDEGWNCIKRELLPALAWWTVTLTPSPEMPDMQPKESTFEMIRRLTHAIDEMEALD